MIFVGVFSKARRVCVSPDFVGMFGHTFVGVFGHVRVCVCFGHFTYGDVTPAEIRQAFRSRACGILTDVLR